MVALMSPAAGGLLIRLISRAAVSQLREGTVGDGIASGDGLMGAGGGGLAVGGWIADGDARTGWPGVTGPAVGGPPGGQAGRTAAETALHPRLDGLLTRQRPPPPHCYAVP